MNGGAPVPPPWASWEEAVLKNRVHVVKEGFVRQRTNDRHPSLGDDRATPGSINRQQAVSLHRPHSRQADHFAIRFDFDEYLEPPLLVASLTVLQDGTHIIELDSPPNVSPVFRFNVLEDMEHVP